MTQTALPGLSSTAVAPGSTLVLKAAQIAARGLVAPDPVGGTWVAVMLKPSQDSIDRIRPFSKTPDEDLHTTLVMCGKTADLVKRGFNIDHFTQALKPVADWNTPLDAKIGGVTRFHSPEGAKDPVVLSINSRGLGDFRTQVIAALEQAGVHEETEHGYTPHMTIGYLPQDKPLTLRHIPLTDITFDRILIGFGGTYAELPLEDNGMHGFKSLDVKGDRYVRTPEGARFYGQPIGALIEAGPSVRIDGVPGHIDKRDPNIHEPYDDRNSWCYQHAAQYAVANSTPDSGPSLVHGQVQISPKFPAINHSWVVWPDGKVFEPNSGHLMTAEEYDDFFHPVVEAQYTPAQMREQIATRKNWGPWHEGLRVSDVIARVVNAALHLAGKKHDDCTPETKNCPAGQSAAQALKKNRPKKQVAPGKAKKAKKTGKNAKTSLRQRAKKTAKATSRCAPANAQPYVGTPGLKAAALLLEAKARHVRDAGYWGLPVGTPITPGMKPLPHSAPSTHIDNVLAREKNRQAQNTPDPQKALADRFYDAWTNDRERPLMDRMSSDELDAMAAAVEADDRHKDYDFNMVGMLKREADKRRQSEHAWDAYDDDEQETLKSEYGEDFTPYPLPKGVTMDSIFDPSAVDSFDVWRQFDDWANEVPGADVFAADLITEKIGSSGWNTSGEESVEAYNRFRSVINPIEANRDGGHTWGEVLAALHAKHTGEGDDIAQRAIDHVVEGMREGAVPSVTTPLVNAGHEMYPDMESIAGFAYRAFSTYTEPYTTEVTAMSVGDGEASIFGRVDHYESGEVGEFKRTLDFRHMEIHHDEFTISRAHQGQGVSDALYDSTIQMGRQYGFTKIKIHADIDVGGYAWARRGFTWDGGKPTGYGASTMVSQWNELKDEYKHVWNPDFVARCDDMVRLLESDTPPTPNELAMMGRDMKMEPKSVTNEDGDVTLIPMWPGKALMLGSDWYGELPLDDDTPIMSKADAQSFMDAVRALYPDADRHFVKNAHPLTHDGDTSDYNCHFLDLMVGPDMESKDVYGGMPGLSQPYQHGHPVPRKKRKSVRTMAVELVSTSTSMKSLLTFNEVKAAARDGDGDGFINDSTSPTPTPPGTPVSKHTTFVGPSDFAGAHVIKGDDGKQYVVGQDPNDKEWFAVVKPRANGDFWAQHVASGKTAKEMMRALDTHISKGGSDKPTPAAKPSARTAAKRTTARAAAKKPSTRKPAAAKPEKDPNTFGRSGTEWQTAGQNEESTLEGEVVVGPRKNWDNSKKMIRQMTVVKPGSKTEAYLRKKYGIPPKYTTIKFNHSRNEKDPDDTYDGMVYTALDPKTGKWQPVYSVRWRNLRNGLKENKVGQLSQNMPKVSAALQKDAFGKDERKKAAARAIMVQSYTGLRIGNKDSADDGSYGASTLLTKHATLLANNKVKLSFKGKGRHKRLDDQGNPMKDEDGKIVWDAGSDYSITIKSKELHEMIADAKIGKKPGDQLFGNADHNAYLKALSKDLGMDPPVTSHNFRHNFATSKAAVLLKEAANANPKSEAQYQAIQKKIVEQVAALINDTKKIAFGSYIQPSVWDAIRKEPEWKDASIK